MTNINSILDLEKCIPKRENINFNWQVLERNNHTKRRNENKRLLPLSIMVKIKGPPKVLDPYRMTDIADAENNNPGDVNSLSTNCTPLNIFHNSSSPVKSSPSPDKHALPQRPALLQSKQIPGRYFPKPVTLEESRAVSGGWRKILVYPVSKPSPGGSRMNRKNVKPEVSRTYHFSKTKAEATNVYNEKIIRERKSLYEQSKDRDSMMSISYFDPDSKADNNNNKQNVSSTYFSIQRFISTSRYASFSGGKQEFGDILKGTPKTIHMREDAAGIRLTSMSTRNSSSRVHFEEPEVACTI